MGTLFQGSIESTLNNVKNLIDKEKPAKIITVGDQVSKDFSENLIQPDVLIVDEKIMRKRIAPIHLAADEITQVMNPPGTITDEAWQTVERAILSPGCTKILVDGEEDLLALVAILTAPESSLVFYGQPHKGIVAVVVTAETKQKMREIFDAMQIAREN
ncbi:MAG: GTP-dependent dephospho-CoA kinase family protein [Candidatus Bathyarchaeota archaeon]|nr:MAG: GTP-dependent dephospho-CoA kinase family protein [Candidatus Bathyarchaeota archaeon]